MAEPLSAQPGRAGEREPLSEREQTVLALTARGMTNRQIADQLAVSVHGVKFHLAAIFRKLGVENRTAAAAVYLSSRESVSE